MKVSFYIQKHLNGARAYCPRDNIAKDAEVGAAIKRKRRGFVKMGRELKFNKDQFVDLYIEFCEEIAKEGFKTIPSQTSFSRWVSERYENVSRRTIYNYMHKYFPDIKKRVCEMQGDTIIEGGMLGAYQSAAAIFALKHWCGWKDKVFTEDESDKDVNVTIEVL